MIHLRVTDKRLEESSEEMLEEFKGTLLSILNRLPADKHIKNRWAITKISEGNAAHLIYDERSAATLTIADGSLHIETAEKAPRENDVLFASRYAAEWLHFNVYSVLHKGAQLPTDHNLALDHPLFTLTKDLHSFFEKSNYTLRYTSLSMVYNKEVEEYDYDLAAPYYAERKSDGAMYIINPPMLDFLRRKQKQKPNREFAYKVADSMDDFAKKYDLGLIPKSFYQCYNLPVQIINDTDFDIHHLKRKVFIEPFVFDFTDRNKRHNFATISRGVRLMDKVRKGEKIDDSIRRILKEELQLNENYVGARIWGIEFDRDKEGLLTPRLKMDIYIHGLTEKQSAATHDWMSIK